MIISFAGKTWDTKKTYYAAGHEENGRWKPYESEEELPPGLKECPCRPCRMDRIFIDTKDGEIESLLFQVENEPYGIIRLGWSPVGFVDTMEKKVMANVKKLAPKK
ncbi:MAG: hypothetical protein LUE14_02985 [Clostridiales bacterium]|nr:hypothetical protein [Clostridiales bacterium]